MANVMTCARASFTIAEKMYLLTRVSLQDIQQILHGKCDALRSSIFFTFG